MKSLSWRLVVPALLLLVVVGPVDAGQSDADTSRTPWGGADLQGVWDFRSVTPLERPAEFENQEYLHPLAAAEVELWGDPGTELAGGNRTALIVDPPPMGRKTGS